VDVFFWTQCRTFLNTLFMLYWGRGWSGVPRGRESCDGCVWRSNTGGSCEMSVIGVMWAAACEYRTVISQAWGRQITHSVSVGQVITKCARWLTARRCTVSSQSTVLTAHTTSAIHHSTTSFVLATPNAVDLAIKQLSAFSARNSSPYWTITLKNHSWCVPPTSQPHYALHASARPFVLSQCLVL